MKSSIRQIHSLLRNNPPSNPINDQRGNYTPSNQSSTNRSKNQGWGDNSTSYSLHENPQQLLKSPSNPNYPSSSSKPYKTRYERAPVYDDPYNLPNVISPTNARFQQVSPRLKTTSRTNYESGQENNEQPLSSRNATVSQSRDFRGEEQQPKDYIKLEKEIIGLKNEIMGRLQNNPKTSRALPRAENIVSDSSSSSPEPAQRINKAGANDNLRRHHEKNASKAITKNRSDSKIKIYDEEETLVEEPKGQANVKRVREESRGADRSVEQGLTKRKREGREGRDYEKKYKESKTKFKEMKGILRSYVNKVIDLEDVLKKKEELLNGCESQIRNDQKKLMKSNDLIQELRTREGGASESELKAKILDQREELKRLHSLLDDAEERSRLNFENLTQENGQFRADMESLRAREASLKERLEQRSREFEPLQRELNAKENLLMRFEAERNEREAQIRALREELERVRIENEKTERRYDEYNKEFELEVAVAKKQVEEDARGVIEEKNNQILIKKEKIKKLKQELREYEKIASKAIEEKKFAGHEIEKLVGQKTNSEREMYKTRDELKIANKEILTLKATLDSLKNQFNETYETLRSESARSESIQTELKKVNKLLKMSENKTLLKDKDTERLEETNGKLKAELKNALEENKKFRGYISELEDRVAFLQQTQSQDISKVESKIEEFYREIYLLKEENKALRTAEVSLNREIDVLREEKERARGDFKEMKYANKILEKELHELSRNMNEVINDKMNEIVRQNRALNTSFEKDVKMEVMGEVQDMIKNHRQSIRRFE